MFRDSTRILSAVAAFAAVACFAAPASAQGDSRGVYRLPYANGTQIAIDGDGDPVNHRSAADLNGVGGGLYRIVAAADGVVRRIQDGFNQTGRTSAQGCNNNFVWIEHDNGEWTKYSHFRQNSVTTKARVRIGQRVRAGAYLGDEGDVGCAQGQHLHFEVARPDSGIGTDGFLNAIDADRRIPRICNIPSGRLRPNSSYVAESVPGVLPRGRREVAAHGLPIEDYQCYFDQMADSGYEPEWLDMYDSGGRTFVNVVGQRANGAGSAFHGLTGGQYQARFNSLTGSGYRLVIVESYLQNGQVRYAGFFKRTSGPAFVAYHGLSASAHQTRFEELSRQGFQPRMISVVSAGGQMRVTGLYERMQGSFVLRSQISLAEYQQVFNENVNAGRRPISLNAYVHNGRPMIAAVFSSAAGGGTYRHGLSGAQYQSAYEAATGAGLSTRIVTGYQDGGHRFAAAWRQ
jgi:hypothetical protein